MDHKSQWINHHSVLSISIIFLKPLENGGEKRRKSWMSINTVNTPLIMFFSLVLILFWKLKSLEYGCRNAVKELKTPKNLVFFWKFLQKKGAGGFLWSKSHWISGQKSKNYDWYYIRNLRKKSLPEGGAHISQRNWTFLIQVYFTWLNSTYIHILY